MTVKELVSIVSGVDNIEVYEQDTFLCDISKTDLDIDLEMDVDVWNKEVKSMDFSLYEGYGEDSTGEHLIGFTRILSIFIE